MKIASIVVVNACASLLATATAHPRHHGHDRHHHHHHSDSQVDTSKIRRILEGDIAQEGFDPADTAVVIIDPQNDFLSENGVAWGVVGEAVTEHNTVDHIDQLFQAARDNGFSTFISPHYYFPHDKKWKFEGELEKLMHEIGMFDRADPLSLDGFEGSGADWLEQYKDHIAQDNVIVTNPHKMYGPQTNDLTLQLRKRGIDRIILGGMSANLCVESHLRELLEQGFEVFVVGDATAGARTPALGDGDAAARINYGYLSNGVLNTTEAVTAMGTIPPNRAVIEDEGITQINGDNDVTTKTNGDHSEEEQTNGAKLLSVGFVTGTVIATFITSWL